jgi:hypothetical protein
LNGDGSRDARHQAASDLQDGRRGTLQIELGVAISFHLLFETPLTAFTGENASGA